MESKEIIRPKAFLLILRSHRDKPNTTSKWVKVGQILTSRQLLNLLDFIYAFVWVWVSVPFKGILSPCGDMNWPSLFILSVVIFLNFSYNIFWSYSPPQVFIVLSSLLAYPSSCLSLFQNSKQNKQTKSIKWIYFVLVNNSWEWGITWSVINIHSVNIHHWKKLLFPSSSS